jgi:hypothetical protein
LRIHASEYGHIYKVVSVDTDDEIMDVVEADDEEGWYDYFVRNTEGRLIIEPDNEFRKERAFARIKFVEIKRD